MLGEEVEQGCPVLCRWEGEMGRAGYMSMFLLEVLYFHIPIHASPTHPVHPPTPSTHLIDVARDDGHLRLRVEAHADTRRRLVRHLRGWGSGSGQGSGSGLGQGLG